MTEKTTEQDAKWYAIQTYAGHENKVRTLILNRIQEEEGDSVEEKEIQEVLVPTHEVVEVQVSGSELRDGENTLAFEMPHFPKERDRYVYIYELEADVRFG